jgi:DNA-directed RNA polymerase subunit K/omega
VIEENPTPETQPEVAPDTIQPIVKVTPPESRFLFVDVAAMRAKQLRRGARPRLEGYADAAAAEQVPTHAHPQKAERIAMEEVRQGLVSFEFPVAKPEAPGGVE